MFLCARAALTTKAKDVIILNVKSLSSFADYFLICSGTSDRQVQAIASSIQQELKEFGMMPLGVEGVTSAKWVLLDYDDVVIHIFYEPIREFYEIERLWSDAPRLEIGDDLPEMSAFD